MTKLMTEERLAELEAQYAAFPAHFELCRALRAERAALEREREKVRVLHEAVDYIRDTARAAERSEKRESRSRIQNSLASIHGACQDALAATKETP